MVLTLLIIVCLLLSEKGKQRAIAISIFTPPASKKNKIKIVVKRLIAALLIPAIKELTKAVPLAVIKATDFSETICKLVVLSRQRIVSVKRLIITCTSKLTLCTKSMRYHKKIDNGISTKVVTAIVIIHGAMDGEKRVESNRLTLLNKIQRVIAPKVPFKKGNA